MDPLTKLSEPPAPEALQLLDAAVQMAQTLPPLESMTPEQRRQMNPPAPKLDNAVDREAGGVPVRMFVPEAVDGVYVYIHGGGWMGGAHDGLDAELWARAQSARAAVVSVGYRLAPEHRFPAAQDDCEAALRWVISNARSEFGTDSIVIGGDSAGAHLSVVTAVRLRDHDGYTGARGLELRYGCYDLRLTPSVRSFDKPLLDAPQVNWIVNQVVDRELLDHPDVSPIFADLRGLPPALFTVGTADSLLDDTLFMWARWRAAGNEAELDVVPGAVHAFDHAPLGFAQQAAARISKWIGDRLRA